MDPDNYQQAWQAQASQTRFTIDPDVLLKTVQRNERDFRSMIYHRDLREVGVALVLVPVWIYMGIKMSSPWTWYLAVPACLWIAGFMLVDRMRHKRKPSEAGEPLLQSAQESLSQVEHQIWLLRNVFWWYLLPIAIAMLAFLVQVSWDKARDWRDALTDANAVVFVFFVAFFYFLYYVNQRAVRLNLEPRRQELLALLASLGDKGPNDS